MASEAILWKAVGGASGVAVGAATRTFLRTAWRKTKGGDPPTNPASPETTWKEALLLGRGVGHGAVRRPTGQPVGCRRRLEGEDRQLPAGTGNRQPLIKPGSP